MSKTGSTTVWTDVDLAYLYLEDAGLLAIADTVVEAGRTQDQVASTAGPRRWLRRAPGRLLIVAVAAAVLFTGVALADGLDPFAGIGAAEHDPTPGDALDPAVAAALQSFNADTRSTTMGSLIVSSARSVGEVPSGHRIYVVSTTTGELCMLMQPGQGLTLGCGAPLTQALPTTRGSFGSSPPFSFGIARDDVAAVSFDINGSELLIPVKDNAWFYEGDLDIRDPLTVHYQDGTTQTLT